MMKGKKMTERKEYLQKNWTTFRRNVVKYIQQNGGIASMAEVFDMYSAVFPKTVWQTPKLEEIAKFLVAYGGCLRIDLAINNPKPLAIYPGHHRIKTTTFFVINKSKKIDENGDIISDNEDNSIENLTEENHQEDVEKAQALLDDLVEKAKKVEALNREKKSSRKHASDESKKASKAKEAIDDFADLISQKEQIPDESLENNNSESATNHKRIFNGYIPMKSARFQIFQEFILHTFGSKPFSVNDIVDNMSFDLMAKIIGFKEFPDIIAKEPRLRHILVRCFPERILSQIEFSTVRDSVRKLLLLMTEHTLKSMSPQKLFLFNCKNPHNKGSSPFKDNYRLFDSSTINFFDQFEISYNFSEEYQIELFHKMIKAVELIENIDPHSSDLWLKRNALARPHRISANKLTLSIVDKVVHEPYELTFPFNFSEVEKFVEKNGENWINFQSSLNPIFEKNSRIIRKGKKNPSKGPISEFCEGTSENSFRQNPSLFFDDLNCQDFEFLRGYDKNVIFNYLSAVMQLMPNGLIVNLPRPWSKSLEILKELTGINKDDFLHFSAPQNFNAFLINTDRDYHNLNDYTVAHLSIINKNFSQEIDESSISNCFELSTSQYLQRFNLHHIRFQMPIEMAELVERLKIISLTPKEIFILSDAKRLLTEIDNEFIEDAVFYLKLSRFMNQPLIDNEPDRSSRFRVTKRTLADFSLHRPFSLYENIVKYFKLAKDPSKVEGAAESNSGAVAYLLDPDVPLTINLKIGRTNNDSNENVKKLNIRNDNDNENESVMDDADLLEESFVDPGMIDSTAVLLKMSKSSMTVTSKKHQANETMVVKSKTIGLPFLPSFPLNVDLSANEYEAKQFFDFRDYSGDTSDHLYSTFMQLYVIMYQLHKDDNMFILLIRLVYSFILNGFSGPVSLNDIIKYSMDVYSDKDFGTIFDSLLALEQFGFIYRLNVNKAMPYFVSDVYAKNHFIKFKLEPKKYIDVKPHLWTCADGSVEPQMLEKLQMKLAEIIDGAPGIEFMEIASKMSALSLVDLYQILDVLELDEVIYSRFDIIQKGSIFDFDEDGDNCESSNLPSPSVDSIMFFYNLALSLNDPNIKQVRRYFYPTQRNNFNLALNIIS